MTLVCLDRKSKRIEFFSALFLYWELHSKIWKHSYNRTIGKIGWQHKDHCSLRIWGCTGRQLQVINRGICFGLAMHPGQNLLVRGWEPGARFWISLVKGDVLEMMPCLQLCMHCMLADEYHSRNWVLAALWLLDLSSRWNNDKIG